MTRRSRVMSTPGQYDQEPTREVPAQLFQAWVKAREAVALWERERDRLRKEPDRIGEDAWAYAVDGVKVVTNRPGPGYAAAKLVRDYPDVTQQFMVQPTERVLAVDSFVAAHPD